ncbi:MAG TPA: hypothetical protein VK929_06590 [Longimicrobiales bacterium]|nr:hypothetical protein [Longimicrobiales bacterium]
MPRTQTTAEMAGGAGRKPVGRWLLPLLTATVLGLGGCAGDTLYTDPTGPTDPGGPDPLPPGTGRGELIAIPGVGIIADMVVDARSGLAFLSNQGQHRIEVLGLTSLEFRENGIPVGSQPWGLSLNWDRAGNQTGDTLIVANSGGTNVSFVSTAGLAEDVGRRFSIPRIILYEVDYTDEDGVTVYTDIRFYNYADRPQHVVQDSRGRLVYSALSTAAAPVGSVRIAEFLDGWGQWDARYLFHERSLVNAEGTLAIANADSMYLMGNRAVIYDHVPGSLPRQALVSPLLPIEDAVANLQGRGSDVELYIDAAWRVPEGLGLADTTYVAASGDRRFVAIGEGARDRASRIIMWSADDGRSSLVEDVADIVNNTSDLVYGVELNDNGTLGVARGGENTYFFGTDLRLQGLTRAGGGGGRGAAFLPGAASNRTYAFEPTLAGTLRILETTHYMPVAEIRLREPITGPFRVGPARPGTTACPADFRQGPEDCVVATIYGVTANRRLHVADVLRRDIP